MKKAQKQKIISDLLDLHEREYSRKVPARIRDFFAKKAFDYDGKCLPPGTEVPMFEPGSFRLVLVPPSWKLMSTWGGLDDAIVGPDGEWQHAKDFVPLFTSEQSRYVVADLTSPACPVGWFEEETFNEGAKSKIENGYDRGVFSLAPSLDAFLKTLVSLEEVDYDTEADDEIWENASEALEDADDDE